jgi:hypothetical protein
MLLITIDGYIYDVSYYNHPGEGIRGCCLKYYNRKDVSKEFFRMHMTDEPDIILEKARKEGSYENVYYVGPNYFKSRIPKCFYFNKDNNYKDLINEDCFFITLESNIYYFYIGHKKISIDKCGAKYKLFWRSNLYLLDSIEEFIKILKDMGIKSI